MQIIKGLDGTFEFHNPIITIGNFDGVHIGHQKILKRVVSIANQTHGIPIAISFDPHPAKVLSPQKKLKLLTTSDDKVQLLSQLGLKVLIIIPFDEYFSKIEPESFIKDILIDKIGMKWLIVGNNFFFGKKKKGDIKLLRRLGKKYNFGFSVVRYAKKYGKVVCSTNIRALIQRGKVAEATEMLGRPYHIKGTVIKGTGRGSTILNIPTANIKTANELIPKEGVYAAKISFCPPYFTSAINKSTNLANNEDIASNILDGAVNIGKNPTFGDIENISLEVHIFDFDKDLLNANLCIHFIQRVRDEKRFSDVQELRKQIMRDIEIAKAILKKGPEKMFKTACL